MLTGDNFIRAIKILNPIKIEISQLISKKDQHASPPPAKDEPITFLHTEQSALNDNNLNFLDELCVDNSMSMGKINSYFKD